MSERPKLKIKRGFQRNGQRKVPKTKPALTPDEIYARNIAKVEQKHHISPSFIAKLLLQHHGLINGVVRALKIPRSTLVRYIDKHDECLEALHTARDAMGDMAESKLYEAIKAGDVRCILYYLSTVHRHRGYALRAEDQVQDNNGRGPVFVETVNIVGIPSGTFLPKEVAAKDNMVIEN